MKINVEKYKGQKVAVHCPEEWQAELFVEELRKNKYTWTELTSCWGVYKELTCYSLELEGYSGYCDKPRYEKGNYKIALFKELIIGETNELTDPINSPSHYKTGNIEVIDFIEDQKLNYHLGNAVKYISRAGKKDVDKYKEDLLKAIWYLNREVKNNGKK